MLRFIVLCVAVSAVARGATLPKETLRCKHTDAVCMEKSVNEVLSKWSAGVKNINMAPLDPLHITEIRIDQGADSPLNVKMTFSETDLIGFSKGTIKNVKFLKPIAANKFHWKVEASLPVLAIIGTYDITGRVLVLPIVGNGPVNITLSNVAVSVDVKGTHDAIVKNGKTYMQFEAMNLQFETERMHMYLANLFNGDKALGDNMNLFLNENWQDILREIKPSIQDSFGQVFKEISNRMFKKVPLDQLFLE